MTSQKEWFQILPQNRKHRELPENSDSRYPYLGVLFSESVNYMPSRIPSKTLRSIQIIYYTNIDEPKFPFQEFEEISQFRLIHHLGLC